MTRRLMFAIAVSASTAMACSQTLPTECVVNESACEQDRVDDFESYCYDRGMGLSLVRPDVCSSYPFGDDYAGAAYCDDRLVEAWCVQQ